MSQCPCEGERQTKGICPPSTTVGPRDWTRVPWHGSICITHWATSLRLWILPVKERWTPQKLQVIQVAEGFQWGFEIQEVWTAGPHGHCQSLYSTPPSSCSRRDPELVAQGHQINLSVTPLSSQSKDLLIRSIYKSASPAFKVLLWGPGCPSQCYLAHSTQPT